MEWERQRTYDFEAGMEKGIEIGREQGTIENARSAFENGVSMEIIAKSMNLSLEKVHEIVEGKNKVETF